MRIYYESFFFKIEFAFFFLNDQENYYRFNICSTDIILFLSLILEKLLFKAIKIILMIYSSQDGNKFIIFWLLDIESLVNKITKNHKFHFHIKLL